MDILMPLYNVWIKQIFNKEKTLEFRKRIGKDFKENDIIYFYETSKYKGKQKVVGQAQIKQIIPIIHNKNGDYLSLLQYYKEHYTKTQDNKEFNSKSIVDDAFYKYRCIEWLKKIGFLIGDSRYSPYNYAIELYNIKEYETPLDLNNFRNNDKIINKAPQSWCYCNKI